MSAPYSHDNLGEDAYDTERGGPVDRQINFDQVHDPFYSQTDSPAPYPD
jgi:hypothetical protein